MTEIFKDIPHLTFHEWSYFLQQTLLIRCWQLKSSDIEYVCFIEFYGKKGVFATIKLSFCLSQILVKSLSDSRLPLLTWGLYNFQKISSTLI